MKIIQGFVTKNAFIRNENDAVNEFFELSPLSLTFSRERGEYQSPDAQGDILHTFISRDTETGALIIPSQDTVTKIISITNAVLAYCTGNAFDSLGFINYLQAAYNGQISQVSHGLPYEGEFYVIPEWTSWKMADGTDVRIWHVDEAFRSQYSFYEIIVVPPLDNIAEFFGSYATVSTKLKALTTSDMMDRIQNAKGKYPDTYTRLLNFKLHNQNNPAQSTDSSWGVLIYGANGDNIDSIKDAIVDYLLNNSTRTENEWKAIFPEIFLRTEFVFYPRWDEIAIHNTTELSSIYSSLLKPEELIDFVERNSHVPVTRTYISNNLRMIPFDYKSIACGVLCGQTNVPEKVDLRTIFPDYIPVNTSSLDFNRMTEKTRDWVVKMVELLKVAETATEYSTIRNPIRRISRNGKLFISFVYDNVNYLVSAKKNQIV